MTFIAHTIGLPPNSHPLLSSLVPDLLDVHLLGAAQSSWKADLLSSPKEVNLEWSKSVDLHQLIVMQSFQLDTRGRLLGFLEKGYKAEKFLFFSSTCCHLHMKPVVFVLGPWGKPAQEENIMFWRQQRRKRRETWSFLVFPLQNFLSWKIVDREP